MKVSFLVMLSELKFDNEGTFLKLKNGIIPILANIPLQLQKHNIVVRGCEISARDYLAKSVTVE